MFSQNITDFFFFYKKWQLCNDDLHIDISVYQAFHSSGQFINNLLLDNVSKFTILEGFKDF